MRRVGQGALAPGPPSLNRRRNSRGMDKRAHHCPTGNSRMWAMRKLPVVLPICRMRARLRRRANHWHVFPHPASMKRGVTADRHERWGGMRWTRRCRVRMRSQGEAIRERSREARKTSGNVADGQSVWSWHPLLVSSRAEAHSAQPGSEMPCNPRGDGGKRNSSPRRARYKLLKPSRGECRMFPVPPL